MAHRFVGAHCDEMQERERERDRVRVDDEMV
jgi:hypothetical protein